MQNDPNDKNTEPVFQGKIYGGHAEWLSIVREFGKYSVGIVAAELGWDESVIIDGLTINRRLGYSNPNLDQLDTAIQAMIINQCITEADYEAVCCNLPEEGLNVDNFAGFPIN